MSIKNAALEKVLDFYANSSDFNGVPLSKLAKQLEIEYLDLLPVIAELVDEGSVSLQGGENPHIVRWGHYSKQKQLELLKEAENNKVEAMTTFGGDTFDLGEIQIVYESHTLCAYPSPTYLDQHNKESKYDRLPFTKRLANGEAQISPAFFEIDVLERYYRDPRYRFEFEDYSGHISIVETDGKSNLKEADQVFLESFGLGYDEDRNRVAVAYLRYLSDLSAEHQLYWNSKLVNTPCKVVEEYYRNTVLGEWVFSQSLFTAVIEEQRLINEMSHLIAGKPLFRETFEEMKRPKEFTFFTLPTLLNFEAFVGLLDKMISENINKDFFKGDIEEFELVPLGDNMVEKTPKGTLRLLEEWLRKHYRSQDNSGYDLLMAPLRKVRKERQSPAHKINEDYYDKQFFTKQMELMGTVYQSLMSLRCIFHEHRSATSVEIPEWLEKGKIKKF